MKPSYRETSCTAPGCIVTILVFVITLMSFLFISVPGRCDITYTLETIITSCPGCDLYADPNQFLFLSGPSPIAANSISSSTSGSVDLKCGLVNTGSVDSFEFTSATAYAVYGKMGLALSTQTEESPSYITQGITPPCYEISNPAKASAYSYAQVGFQDVLNMTFPGVPSGTPITLRLTKVWDIDLKTTDSLNSPANIHMEIWDPHATKPFDSVLRAPLSVRIIDPFTVSTKSGDSFSISISVDAITNGNAGWSSSWNQSPAVWIPKGISSVIAMNTVAYYIDVLTPGASYFTNSGTIYPTSDSVHLDISLAGTGSGSVKSSPTGIDCGLTCSAYFLPGTTIALAAIPTPDGSIFSGWSGNPTCIGGSVFMTETKSCTATFDMCPGTARASIATTNYDSISLAYGSAATNGDTIKVLASNQQEGPIDFNSGKSVVLVGGYDCSFNNIVSYTMVTGSITISTGDVTFENIVIL